MTTPVPPQVAGDQLLPGSSYPTPEIPDKVYEYVRDIWLNTEEKCVKQPYPDYEDK